MIIDKTMIATESQGVQKRKEKGWAPERPWVP
jgi:hypothetical protein